jgi:hypothetical protein
MATNDHIPLFLPAEEIDQPGIERALFSTVIASRTVKGGILLVGGAAIAFTIWSAGSSLAPVADATASLLGASPQNTGQQMSVVQPSAGGQASALTEEAKGNDSDSAFNIVSGPKIEEPGEALFNQFQAWVAEGDARAQIRPVDASPQAEPTQQAPTQDAPGQDLQNVRAELSPPEKHRQARLEQNAPRVPSAHKSRARVSLERHGRAEVQPVQINQQVRLKQKAKEVRTVHHARSMLRQEQNEAEDALAQDRFVQNAHPEWAEQLFGWLR